MSYYLDLTLDIYYACRNLLNKKKWFEKMSYVLFNSIFYEGLLICFKFPSLEWGFMQHLKSLFGMHLFHKGMSALSPGSFIHFWFSVWLILIPEGCIYWLNNGGSYHMRQRPGWSSRVLATAWASPSCCVLGENEPAVGSHSCSLCLSAFPI